MQRVQLGLDIWATGLDNEINRMITKSQALEIARQECARRGWPWNDHTTVKWGLFSYFVWGGGRKGGNLWIKVRKRDGSVMSATMSSSH